MLIQKYVPSLDAALKQAVAKGYCDWKEIKVIAEGNYEG